MVLCIELDLIVSHSLSDELRADDYLQLTISHSFRVVQPQPPSVTLSLSVNKCG